jgi:hypothetical protein
MPRSRRRKPRTRKTTSPAAPKEAIRLLRPSAPRFRALPGPLQCPLNVATAGKAVELPGPPRGGRTLSGRSAPAGETCAPPRPRWRSARRGPQRIRRWGTQETWREEARKGGCASAPPWSCVREGGGLEEEEGREGTPACKTPGRHAHARKTAPPRERTLARSRAAPEIANWGSKNDKIRLSCTL